MQILRHCLFISRRGLFICVLCSGPVDRPADQQDSECVPADPRPLQLGPQHGPPVRDPAGHPAHLHPRAAPVYRALPAGAAVVGAGPPLRPPHPPHGRAEAVHPEEGQRHQRTRSSRLSEYLLLMIPLPSHHLLDSFVRQINSSPYTVTASVKRFKIKYI